MISQSYQNPLVISSPNLTWMDYFFHNTKQAFLTILLGFVTYGFGSLALGAISGISAGISKIACGRNKGDQFWLRKRPAFIKKYSLIRKSRRDYMAERSQWKRKDHTSANYYAAY